MSDVATGPMPDKTGFNAKVVENAVSDDTPAPGDNPAHVDARGRLPAEQKFDKRVYGGISYFAQAAAGVVLTNWIRHGSGRPYFDKMANWLGPNILSKITKKKGAEAVKEADSWIVVSTMVMMGNIFLAPVKWLEDRKPHFVRMINTSSNARREAHGEVISPEERAEQEKHLALLDKAPRQTWGSLLGGRAFGLAAVYTALWGIGKKNNGAMEELFTSTIQGSAKSVGLKTLGKSKSLENYSRISFYDIFYSAISAGGLYVYSHFIAPPKKRGVSDMPQEIVLPPMEEAVLEGIDSRIPSGYAARNGHVENRSQKQMPAPPQNLAHVESIAPSQPAIAEMAP